MKNEKLQGFIHGFIMSYAMAVGMELYNRAYSMDFHMQSGGLSSMTNEIFLPALAETALPAVCLGTVFKNFPMAFFWNFFAAAPFTHWLCGRLFPSES